LELTADLAGELGIWTVIGSAHLLTPPRRPHNSMYVVSDQGQLVDRYDKRFCSHAEVTQYYTPGSSPVVFEVDGYRFGMATCFEINFPQLFTEYADLGVDCLLLPDLPGRRDLSHQGDCAGRDQCVLDRSLLGGAAE